MQWITDWRIGRRRGDHGRFVQVGIFGGIRVGRQVVVLHDDDSDRLHARNIRTAVAQVDRSEKYQPFPARAFGHSFLRCHERLYRGACVAETKTVRRCLIPGKQRLQFAAHIDEHRHEMS